jgi:hypothetical protein
MHASIWKWQGDPEELAGRYDALLAEFSAARIDLQLCLRLPDGLLIIDTCPTEEAFRSFVAAPEFAAMLKRHGLPPLSDLEDHPVYAAIAGGRELLESGVRLVDEL